MPEFAIKCPHCQSMDVEPSGPQVWTCRNPKCGKQFQEAAVQDLSKPPAAKPKPKKRI